MAWTWLYSSSYNFGGYKEYRAFIGYDQANYASYSRCWWSIGVQMKYASQYGVTAVASGAASGSCEGYLSSSPGGTWKDVCRKDGYFDVTRTTSKQTKTVTSTAKGKTVSGMGSAGGSGVSKSYTYTIPALASYTIKYNANGSGASGAPGNQTKYYGKPLTLSSTVPTRSGYKFLGWALTSGATIPYYTKTDNTCYRNENLTLYAVWEEEVYKMSYFGNGHTDGVTHDDFKERNVDRPIQECGNTKLHYRFVTWNTASNGSGKNYAPGDLYTENAPISLYAQWEYNATKIIYYKNNGKDTSPESQEIDVGQSGELADGTGLIPPTNKHFVEWNTNPDGSGISYAPKTIFISNTPNDKFELYAIYINNYQLPKVFPTITRVDADGNESVGGKDLKLSFRCQNARMANGALVQGQYTLQYLNGETWSTYTDPSEEVHTSGNIDDKKTISISKIENIDSQPYKNFRVVIPDSEAEEGEVVVPIDVPERVDNSQPVTVSNVSIERESDYSDTIKIKFDWTSYYDGHEYYKESTVFHLIKEKIGEQAQNNNDNNDNNNDSNNSESDANNNNNNGFTIGATGVKGTIVYDAQTLNLDESAQISFNKAVSTKTGADPITSDLSSITSYTIQEGGLPVHINSSGSGISLFGIARDDLSGFEVNKPTILNNSLDITGVTIVNNVLTANELSIVKPNGLKIDDNKIDYIVSSGEENSWKYIKYSNGMAMCYGTLQAKVTQWTSWGQMYYATMHSFTYPTGLFIEKPTIQVQAKMGYGTNGDLFGVGFSNSTSYDTLSQTPRMYALRPTTGLTGNIYYHIVAYGKWK